MKDVIELVRKIIWYDPATAACPVTAAKTKSMSVLSYEAVHGPCQVSERKHISRTLDKVLHFLNGDFQETIDQLTEK